MKPTMHINNSRGSTSETQRRFPNMNFDYSAIEMSNCNARCADLSGSSFRSTRDYFDHEANRDFLSEAAVFGTMMLAIAMPVFNGIHAIIDLIRAGI
jgi:hypothetical protein